MLLSGKPKLSQVYSGSSGEMAVESSPSLKFMLCEGRGLSILVPSATWGVSGAERLKLDFGGGERNVRSGSVGDGPHVSIVISQQGTDNCCVNRVQKDTTSNRSNKKKQSKPQ